MNTCIFFFWGGGLVVKKLLETSHCLNILKCSLILWSTFSFSIFSSSLTVLSTTMPINKSEANQSINQSIYSVSSINELGAQRRVTINVLNTLHRHLVSLSANAESLYIPANTPLFAQYCHNNDSNLRRVDKKREFIRYLICTAGQRSKFCWPVHDDLWDSKQNSSLP